MKRIIAAVLILTACGTAVFAGEMMKDGSVLLGYGMPSGDTGDLVDGGIAFGAGYDAYKINDMFTIGGEFMYTSGSGSLAADPLLGLAVDYSLSVWGITPYIKASKEVDLGGKKADVYGLFGLGMYGATFDVELPAAYAAYNTSASDTKIGFNLGGGIMFPMGDKMKLGADLRYHIVASDVSYFIPSAKFTYSF